ncbi:unnamed protein product [Didymodactylos carnosus]|uniref:Uncharacterized protein n=1 Tax=Didymodactylos carnosus TaxID=1234261 RepID=A0A8S2FNE0_9BILA|nr:unnamed protein product [Didymodactylos carnosus]CAF4304333.1 unnamed protein product [Didymodactylos carnosus]
MKVIPRRIYDRVMLDELDINMGERNNIIRLTSLNHNQLSSESFRRMIQYTWYASGYTDAHPGPFKTVAEENILRQQEHIYAWGGPMDELRQFLCYQMFTNQQIPNSVSDKDQNFQQYYSRRLQGRV